MPPQLSDKKDPGISHTVCCSSKTLKLSVFRTTPWFDRLFIESLYDRVTAIAFAFPLKPIWTQTNDTNNLNFWSSYSKLKLWNKPVREKTIVAASFKLEFLIFKHEFCTHEASRSAFYRRSRAFQSADQTNLEKGKVKRWNPLAVTAGVAPESTTITEMWLNSFESAIHASGLLRRPKFWINLVCYIYGIISCFLQIQLEIEPNLYV